MTTTCEYCPDGATDVRPDRYGGHVCADCRGPAPIGAARHRQAPGPATQPEQPERVPSRAEQVQAAAPRLRLIGGDLDGVTRWDARHLDPAEAIPIPVDVPAVVRMPARWDVLGAVATATVGSTVPVVVGQRAAGAEGAAGGIVAVTLVAAVLIKTGPRATPRGRHVEPARPRRRIALRVVEDPS